MADRVQCCVPFCNRTRKPNKFTEWICGPHWKAVPPQYRRLYTHRKRVLKREGSDYRPHVQRVWEMCKRQAIERAAGI